jgi:hypothetical protein
MEEVTGSIPVRSTNQINNLDRRNVQRLGVCIISCAITRHFAAGEGFYRCALRFHLHMTDQSKFQTS